MDRLVWRNTLRLRGDLHLSCPAVIPLRDGVRQFFRGQCFSRRPIVWHGTCGGLACLVHKHLASQYVSGGSRNGGYVLVVPGDGSYCHVGQAIIAGVGCHVLLGFGRRDGLALEVIVSTSGHPGHRATAVVVAFGDGICIALLDSSRYRSSVLNSLNFRCQLGQIVRACADAQFNGL